MALYTYRAMDKQGEIVQDKAEGSGTLAVATELRHQGLLVIEVKEQGAAQKDILAPFKRIKLGDLVVFSRQLATMINAGLPIVRALYVLSEQTENPKLKDVVVEVRQDVEAGSSLSESLEKHPDVFSRLYVEMVKAGEIGGMLDGVLLRVADQLERDQDLRRKVKSAMTYPVVVLRRPRRRPQPSLRANSASTEHQLPQAPTTLAGARPGGEMVSRVQAKFVQQVVRERGPNTRCAERDAAPVLGDSFPPQTAHRLLMVGKGG